MHGFSVQFKRSLNQFSLSLSHESNKKMKRAKQNKKTDEQLSPEMVIKIREIRPKR